MQRKIMELPPFGRDVEIRGSSFDAASNSVEVIWTTGAKVRRYSYAEGVFYDEELVVSANSVRLDRLNGGAPFLDTHDDWTLASVIGTVVPGTAELRSGKGYARVQLSVAPEHAGIVANIRAGVIRNISVGYRIYAVEKTEGDAGSVAVWRVTDWEPLELSAVPVPADAGSQIRSGKDGMNEKRLAPCVVIEAGASPVSPAAAARARMRMRMRMIGL